MAKAADGFGGNGTGTIERGRGGFYRNAADVAYVSDPTGAVVKSGPRKGEVKRLAYGSPSNRGKLISNDSALVKWGERRVVLGIGLDRALVDRCSQLVTLELDSDEYKTAADGIIVAAKDAAEANLAADRGTHVHTLTEDHDTDRDWITRAAAGELIGIPTEIQAQAVAAWNTMLDEHGLEVLAVEASCVDDTWRLAGTLDRIVRCTKTLRFRNVHSEIIEIPAGTIVVGDVKTSKKRLDRDGVVGWWQSYAIQIASYAQSKPYDTETEQRGEWEWPIDQTHAVILRPNVVEVLAGEADTIKWELIYVDLVAGREHGGECVAQAKAWESRRDIFSVAQLDGDVQVAASALSPIAEKPIGLTPLGVDAALNSTTIADPASAMVVETVAVPAPPDAPAPHGLAGGDIAGAFASAPQGAGTAKPRKKTPTTARDGYTARKAVDLEADARRRLTTKPDEGDQSTSATFATLKGHYHKLDNTAKDWIKTISNEADAAGVPFTTNGGTNQTVRRYELLRALVHLAGEQTEHATVRELLAAIIGTHQLYADKSLGFLIGTLSAVEAAQFAGLAAGTQALTIDVDGNVRVAA